MSHENFHAALLDDSGLKSLKALENELGLVMVAVEKDPKPAQLSADQIAKIQSTESELGTIIVAYDS